RDRHPCLWLMVGARQPPFRTFTVEMTPMLGVQEKAHAALTCAKMESAYDELYPCFHFPVDLIFGKGRDTRDVSVFLRKEAAGNCHGFGRLVRCTRANCMELDLTVLAHRGSERACDGARLGPGRYAQYGWDLLFRFHCHFGFLQ